MTVHRRTVSQWHVLGRVVQQQKPAHKSEPHLLRESPPWCPPTAAGQSAQ